MLAKLKECRVAIRAVTLCALFGGGGAAFLASHSSRSMTYTTIARTAIQNSGSTIHPRTAARRTPPDQCVVERECVGFIWL